MENTEQSFKVTIEEILSRTIEIEAKTKQEALDIALEQYRKEEIILDDNDYIGEPSIDINK